jgi:hypothetical protein
MKADMGAPSRDGLGGPDGLEPPSRLHASHAIPSAILYATVVRGFAVLREAKRAGKDSAHWPRLSPGEAGNIFTALDEAVERVRDLELALGLALDSLIQHEPGDSRAVSDEFVAMAVIAAGQTERLDECRNIIRSAAIAMEAAPAGETAQTGSTGTATARADRHRPKGNTQ